jgi:predicted  nucleic acid-binding Zn-ribbon protein
MNEDSTKKLGDQANSRFDELFQMVQAIGSELADLKQTVDSRFHDTRPIWEKVQADIGQLQEGQKSLAEGQSSLSASQQRFEERLEALRDEMRTGFRDLKRQFSVLNDTFLEARADYKDLDKRVFQLEGQGT